MFEMNQLSFEATTDEASPNRHYMYDINIARSDLVGRLHSQVL